MTSEKHKRARTCAYCGCYDPIDETQGLCRSQAPRLSVDRREADAAWPRVSDDDWCVEGFKSTLIPRRES